MSITTRDRVAPAAAAPEPPPPRRPLSSPSVRAARAGVEAAVLGWLCAVVPALAAYAATASLPALGEATWTQAAAVGAALWRLGQGVGVVTTEATVTVVPVGLGALAAALVLLSLRRTRVLTWPGATAAVGGYVAAAAVLALVAPPAERQPLAVLPGALVVGLVGVLAALGRRRDGFPPLPAWARSGLDRLPAVLGAVVPLGLRAAGRALLVLLGLGTLLATASVVGATARFGEVVADLRIDVASTVMLVLACAALLPTFAVWGLAWLAGPGFAVGEGTIVAPGEVVLGTLPALPVLTALPAPGTVGAGGPWAPAVVVGVGALLGWWLHRAREGRSVATLAAVGVLACLACGAGAWFLAELSSGSVGPGRMAAIGPVALDVAVAVAGWLAAGALAVVVLGHPDTHRAVRRGLRWTRLQVSGALPALRPSRFRRQAEDDGDDEAPVESVDAPQAAAEPAEPTAAAGPAEATASDR